MTQAEPTDPPPAAAIEFVPNNYFAPLDLAQVFPRAAPLEIDLGCGDGTFLVALAGRSPERNFLGIEKLLDRVRTTCRHAARADLRNVRVLRVETSYAIEYLLPPCSAAVVHLLFPDPWPKKRHHRRRLVNDRFLAAVHRLLGPSGRLRIATDQEDYFRSIRQLISPALFIEQQRAPNENFPLTRFEKIFIQQGAAIYQLELRKVS